MKKLILLLIIFTSCVTQKQRERILKSCPVASTEKIKDSTWKKETVKYDTTYIKITGPIQYLPSPCETLCDSLGNLKPFKQESTHNGIRQSLESVGNVLVQKCDVDSLLSVNEQKTIEINRLIQKEKETQIHENCKLKHFTDFDSFLIVSAKIMWLIVILYILFRLIKGWLKVQFPLLGRFIK